MLLNACKTFFGYFNALQSHNAETKKLEKRLMQKFHSMDYYCSRNLSFCQCNSADLTGYSSDYAPSLCDIKLFLFITITKNYKFCISGGLK